MRTIVAAAGICLISLPGCSINLVVDGTPPPDAPRPVHPALDPDPREPAAVTIPTSTASRFDPTEAPALAEWWSNERQLLNLRPNGAYRLYEGLNRYRPPSEQGRWWRQTYATMWVQPYDVLTHQSTRVAIQKHDGEFQIAFRELAPMSPLDGPPPVVEDQLMGCWFGAGGSLTLDHGMRYRFVAPPAADVQSPAALAGQQGRWTVERDYLILSPDSAAVNQIVVRIEDEDGRLFLESDAGPMHQE